MSNKAVFLDLQGTLGGDGLGDVMDFEFYLHSFEAIKLLNEHGLLAIVITNQSHIAKGFLTMSDFNNKVQELNGELSEKSAHLNAVYCCPHGEEDNCDCKKPKIGMLMQVQKDFGLKLTESYVVGDIGSN